MIITDNIVVNKSVGIVDFFQALTESIQEKSNNKIRLITQIDSGEIEYIYNFEGYELKIKFYNRTSATDPLITNNTISIGIRFSINNYELQTNNSYVIENVGNRNIAYQILIEKNIIKIAFLFQNETKIGAVSGNILMFEEMPCISITEEEKNEMEYAAFNNTMTNTKSLSQNVIFDRLKYRMMYPKDEIITNKAIIDGIYRIGTITNILDTTYKKVNTIVEYNGQNYLAINPYTLVLLTEE